MPIHYETQTQQQVKVQFFNDTWEYDGSIWTRVADTGPEPRMGCGLVYDGKTMLLFGGKNDITFFKNTWEWDGKHWTQRRDIGPAARAFAAMGYDSVRQRAVLFGSAGQGLFGDTWEQFSRRTSLRDKWLAAICNERGDVPALLPSVDNCSASVSPANLKNSAAGAAAVTVTGAGALFGLALSIS